MRIKKTKKNLTVQAIAGTHVVIIGINLPKTECDGLLGFSIHRTDNDKKSDYLKGMKTFSETDPGFPSGSLYSTQNHPIQDFQWSDYSAKPGVKYTYTITALKGNPKDLKEYKQVDVTITTENPILTKHEVHFNRGLAASQEYDRRFGNKNPAQINNNQAFKWLSRGLYEAMEDYIKSCKPGYKLRIAAYEFHYEKLLKVINETINKGVDIKIIYDARKESPRYKNRKAVKKYNLQTNCIERTEGKSYISHNKFMVKIKDDIPISVWTGGTNFSESGIYGHSNVAHVVKDKKVATDFYQYWKILSKNVTARETRKEIEVINRIPNLPLENGSYSIFSPRVKSSDSLALYSELALTAKKGLFLTFAFGINEIFKKVYQNSSSDLRFALLEKMTRPMKRGSDERKKEEESIKQLRYKKENIFAIGSLIDEYKIKTNFLDGWVAEKLTGLNRNVRYIHNKFMLIDPLSNSPIVVTGSANFSDASTFKNDENMIVIKGDKSVADIYLGEYMRLFTHHSFRESLQWRKADEKPKPLKTNDDEVKWWERHFGDTPDSIMRKYFTNSNN